jgi:anti-sigma-K factor RskA
MTDREQHAENRDCGADAAAYVLGALEPEEVEAFRAHMATCVVCRDEVSAFEEVVAVLPLSAPPQPVPRSLKRRVMASVRAEPRESEAVSRESVRFSPRRFPALPRPALVAGALLLAVVVALGALQLGSGPTRTRVIHASVAWQPGSALLRVIGGRGELIVRRMPVPPGGKVYEVWLERTHRAPSPTSALFSVTRSGSGAVDVPGDLHGVSQVLVTPEPIGGSEVPTHTPVIVARLS